MRKETQCVHRGTIHDDNMGGINTPIFTSSAFKYLDRDDVSYPRYFNTPNQKAVVEKLCAFWKERKMEFSSVQVWPQ